MPSIRDDITRTFVRFGKRLNGQAAPKEFHFREKSEVGQYRLVRKLGAGGMGQVYLALDTKLGRHVALKVLAPQLTADAAHVARFKQEAYAASALNHPNILTIYDFCEIDGAQIIVSEYVEGATLRSALERNLIERKQALDIACQVASALAAAHAAGVVHRDLKPTNIMLRPDGYVKVIDFGLAKLAESSPGERADLTLTRPGMVVGTLRYMSPEQARGEEVDDRGDLWSLGVVLYEMLAGYPPFEGTTDNHLVVAILDAEPRALPDKFTLPPGLVAILSRALAKNKRQRYQSAAQLIDDLNALEPSKVPASSVWLPRRRVPQRRGWLFSSALLLLLAVLFLWWGPFGGRWRVQKPAWFDVSRVERLTFEGDVDRATLSPNGRWLAYTTGLPGAEVLHLRAIPEGSERRLSPSGESYSGLTFSRDSATLFAVLRDTRQELGTLFSVPVSGFGQDPPAMLLPDVDGPVAFSPDGRTLAFVRRSELGSVDTASIYTTSANDVHQARAIVTLKEAQMVGELSWSKRGIAAVVYPTALGQPTKASLYIFQPDGALAAQFSSRDFRGLRSPAFDPSGDSLFVAAQREGVPQYRLEQLFMPTGKWHPVATDLAGFDDISTAELGDTLGAVRSTSRSSVWVSEPGRSSDAQRLTADTEYYTSLAWMNDGRIAVPSARTGNLNLMALGPKGEIQPLASTVPAIENSPATTPARSEVVFSSNRAHGGDDFNIWKTVPGSAGPVRLTSGSNMDIDPQISPDGKWVVYTSLISGATALWRVPLDGGTPQVIARRARKASFSPDGKSLICEARGPGGNWRVVVLAFPDGRILREMPSLPVASLARSSPDGKAVDYIAHGADGWSILRQPLNGGAAEPLVRSPEDKIICFSWSQDGTKLAYVVGRVETDAVLLHRATRD